jgi:glyoxylate carboligase
MGKRGEKQKRKAKIKDKRQSFKKTARKFSMDQNPAEFDRIFEEMLRMDKIQAALERES